MENLKKELLEICEKTLENNKERREFELFGDMDPVSNTGIPETSKFYGKFILSNKILSAFAKKHSLIDRSYEIETFSEKLIEAACDCKMSNHDEYENETDNVDLYSAFEIIFN